MKGLKSPISLKTVASDIPTVLSLDNSGTITNPYNITSTFNNYFTSIAEIAKKKKKRKEKKRSIKCSHKHFSDYLSNGSDSTIFLQPTDKEEILANITSSLNSSKVYLIEYYFF